jgi:hypothetical protein
MKITCLSCRGFVFEIELSSMESFQDFPVVSLACPECGNSTAIHERDGGGIEIMLDKRPEKQRR